MASCSNFGTGNCQQRMRGDVLSKQVIYIDELGTLSYDTVVAPMVKLNRRVFWCQSCKNQCSKQGTKTPTTQKLAKLILTFKKHYDDFIKYYCLTRAVGLEPIPELPQRSRGRGGKTTWLCDNGQWINQDEYNDLKHQIGQMQVERSKIMYNEVLMYDSDLIDIVKSLMLSGELSDFEQVFITSYLGKNIFKQIDRSKFIDLVKTIRKSFNQLHSMGLLRLR